MHAHVWLSYPSFRRPQALYLQTQTRRYNLQVFPRLYRPNTLQYIRIQLVERKFVDFVVIHFFPPLAFFVCRRSRLVSLPLPVRYHPLEMILFAAIPFESPWSDNRNARPRFAVGHCVALFTCILLRRLERLFIDIKNATSFTDVFPYK